MARLSTNSCVVVILLLLGTHARAVVGDPDEAFGLDASLRTITAATVNYDYPLVFGEDNPGDGLSQTLLRLTAGGSPADWFSYEVHAVQSLGFSTLQVATVQGPGLFAGSGADTRYRVLKARWEWAAEPQLQASMWLDRCNLKFVLPFADVSVGRQAVSFGKAYFWNPLDVYLAFDPTQFDREYKAGVDALRIDIPLGDFSGLTLVGVLGRTLGQNGSYEDDASLGASWYGSSVLLRLFTNHFDWDFAIQGGKIYGGFQVGGAASGEVGPLALRAEAAYFLGQDENELDEHFSAVLGLGHRFENTLDIQAEYIYNGAGEDDPINYLAAASRLMTGATFHLGQHLAGVVATYELLPILYGSLAWIFSFTDHSSLIQPGLRLSISDESDFLIGAMIGLGARPQTGAMGFPILKSEFGTYPNYYYMEFKFYF